jgi:hypothetical protein
MGMNNRKQMNKKKRINKNLKFLNKIKKSLQMIHLWLRKEKLLAKINKNKKRLFWLKNNKKNKKKFKKRNKRIIEKQLKKDKKKS